MTDRDKDRLRELICDKLQDDDCISHCNYPPCSKCMYIADYLIANGATMNEWISVEDGLPEIDENNKGRYGFKRSVRVICACKQRDGKTFAKEGYYELRDDGDIFWRIPGTIDSVTHWRPLPELPKEIVE